MATLQVPSSFELASTKCTSFSMGRTLFQYSVNDLSELIGFDEVQDLTEEQMGLRFMDIPDEQAFWGETTSGGTRYRSSVSKSTLFVKWEHKFIHYILPHSICGRYEAISTVSHANLLCLYGMVKRQRIHMGLW
nr:hypothetical protein Iba_scaffold37921CG0300 [Ipomoea batatas]GMD75031.1 hypothetical protein Iba_chr13aCG11000 [Ipomoea batatas]